MVRLKAVVVRIKMMETKNKAFEMSFVFRVSGFGLLVGCWILNSPVKVLARISAKAGQARRVYRGLNFGDW